MIKMEVNAGDFLKSTYMLEILQDNLNAANVS